MVYFFLFITLKKHFQPCFFILKALKDILQHIRELVNWWFRFFFDVTNRLLNTWKLFFLNLTTTPIYWNPPFLHPCSFTVRRVIAKSFKFIIVSETFFQGNLLNKLLILIIIKHFSIHNLINYLTFFNQIFSSVENLFEIFVLADWHQ